VLQFDVFIVFEDIVLMDSDHYRCIFRLTTIVFEITGISVSYSFPIISYQFHFRKNVKIKVIWSPINRFRSLSSLLVGMFLASIRVIFVPNIIVIICFIFFTVTYSNILNWTTGHPIYISRVAWYIFSRSELYNYNSTNKETSWIANSKMRVLIV
jgi:hypothetical protein